MSEVVLVGYDGRTEFVAAEHKTPPNAIEQAKRIAKVPADDPDVAHAYELKPSAAKYIAPMIRVQIDTSKYYFFLEGFAD
ncbi:MAG TPA: hypothetical protein VFA12_02135 [Stellaceae bacterium]|nr:hypothetical protein [Stellaceae bacterium]